MADHQGGPDEGHGRAQTATARERLMVYAPGHRSRGKVAREIDLLPHAWQRDELSFRQARTVTGEMARVVTARSPAGRRALDTEIKIGSRLRLAADGPHVVSQLLGFDDDDDADPALALIGCSGTPLAKAAAALPGGDRQRAALTLLTALEQLSGARVVHRALSPETVLWDTDSRSVQVAGFSRAAILGEPRAGGASDPQWCSPEQARGAGVAVPGDDLYAAALLLFWLFARELPAKDPAGMRQRLALGDDELRRRLDGSFADEPKNRPTLAELTRRWQPREVRAPASRRRDDAAAREFAALRQRQRADPTPLRDPSAVSPAALLTSAERRAIIAVSALVSTVVIVVLLVTLLGG